MAVVNTYSDQLQAVDEDAPTSKVYPDEWSGKLRIAHFTLTQVTAGDATSVAYLVKLPAGRVRILLDKSVIANSAFGTSRTLDIGYGDYTAKDGTTTSGDADAFKADLDVSAAAAAASLAQAAGADPTVLFETRDGLMIQAAVAGGTIPAAATLKGYIVYVKE